MDKLPEVNVLIGILDIPVQQRMESIEIGALQKIYSYGQEPKRHILRVRLKMKRRSEVSGDGPYWESVGAEFVSHTSDQERKEVIEDYVNCQTFNFATFLRILNYEGKSPHRDQQIDLMAKILKYWPYESFQALYYKVHHDYLSMLPREVPKFL
jgi:hypothetical protein